MYTNRKRSENDQYNETSNHIQMKGGGGSGRAGTPGAGGTRRCRRTLSFVYGLMSHCIDRFHFVFYLYTFHFMLPMCILEHIAFWDIFFDHKNIPWPTRCQVHLVVTGTVCGYTTNGTSPYEDNFSHAPPPQL